MQGGPFRKSVARAFGSTPPLRKAVHGRVMQCHLGVDAPDLPALRAQPQAHLGFFARDQILAVSADLVQGAQTHQRIPAAGFRFADRGVPFRIRQPVVDRGFGMPLAAAAADDGGIGLGLQLGYGLGQPVGVEGAIPVQKLDIARLLRGGQRPDPREPRVARACGGKGAGHVEIDDLGTRRAGELRRAVRRAAVDIDDVAHPPRERGQTGAQTLALVAPDQDGIHQSWRGGARGLGHDVSGRSARGWGYNDAKIVPLARGSAAAMGRRFAAPPFCPSTR